MNVPRMAVTIDWLRCEIEGAHSAPLVNAKKRKTNFWDQNFQAPAKAPIARLNVSLGRIA
jgi:hypothetical protein